MAGKLGNQASLTLDTAKRFEYGWSRYDKMYPHYEEQFMNWIAPFKTEAFRGKEVCDAGCGMGRNAYWVLQYGARRVVAFDNASETVASAKKLLAPFPHAVAEQRNIYEIPYENCFDICFSIGVIHHLEDPRRAVLRLVRSLKPGGKLIVWLYGYEGNETYVRFFRLAHPLLKYIPPWATHKIAYFFSVPLYFFLRIFPFRSPYFQQIRKFPFRHLHYIVYDQLLPTLARYYRRDEVEELFKDSGLGEVGIHPNRGYSWTVIGVK